MKLQRTINFVLLYIRDLSAMECFTFLTQTPCFDVSDSTIPYLVYVESENRIFDEKGQEIEIHSLKDKSIYLREIYLLFDVVKLLKGSNATIIWDENIEYFTIE